MAFRYNPINTATSAGPSPGGRTSAVRVFVLTYFRNAGNEDGHRRAGHGMLEQLADTPESPWRSAQRSGNSATFG